MQHDNESPFPAVALWRINLLRFSFLLMALVMGSSVWYRLLFQSANLPGPQGLARSLLAALALLSLLGVRYPMQLLPLMLYEVAWKTIWMGLIALPALLNNRMTPDIESLFYNCVGIVIVYFVMPWRYVWIRYLKQPMEPWRNRN